MEEKQKKISELLHVYVGDISNKQQLNNCLETFAPKSNMVIDTIVNAAKPTLMGSNQGVDGAIHKAIDEQFQANGAFNLKICKELDGLSDIVSKEDIIFEQVRCPRGKAVITKGYGLCNYIIHVVGSQYDGIEADKNTSFKKQQTLFKTCSSSRFKILESCYREIINIIKVHPDIKNVAIPIVGSGEYKFPFELAVRIAFSGIGNALVDWKREDPEAFSDKKKGLQNIIFFVYPDENERYKKAKDVLKEYKEILEKDNQIVVLNSFQSQMQYMNEIKKYDFQRGYFFIARSLRMILAYVRLFFLWTYVKDLTGGRNWQKRRCAVEMITVFKMLFPLISWVLIRHCVVCHDGEIEKVLIGIVCFNLLDTITYLICLIGMADIQNPSANVIRSLILLLFNYFEMAFSMALLYYLHYRGEGLIYREALMIGILSGDSSKITVFTIYEYLLLYVNTLLKFFFVTLVFGYVSGHMRKRKFRS